MIATALGPQRAPSGRRDRHRDRTRHPILMGETEGKDRFEALYGEPLDEPIPERMLALVRSAAARLITTPGGARKNRPRGRQSCFSYSASVSFPASRSWRAPRGPPRTGSYRSSVCGSSQTLAQTGRSRPARHFATSGDFATGSPCGTAPRPCRGSVGEWPAYAATLEPKCKEGAADPDASSPPPEVRMVPAPHRRGRGVKLCRWRMP